LVEEWGIELLGKVPLDPRIGKTGDFGMSFLEEYPESPASDAYRKIVARKSFLFYRDFHLRLTFSFFVSSGIKEKLANKEA